MVECLGSSVWLNSKLWTEFKNSISSSAVVQETAHHPMPTGGQGIFQKSVVASKVRRGAPSSVGAILGPHWKFSLALGWWHLGYSQKHHHGWVRHSHEKYILPPKRRFTWLLWGSQNSIHHPNCEPPSSVNRKNKAFVNETWLTDGSEYYKLGRACWKVLAPQVPAHVLDTTSSGEKPHRRVGFEEWSLVPSQFTFMECLVWRETWLRMLWVCVTRERPGQNEEPDAENPCSVSADHSVALQVSGPRCSPAFLTN